MKSSALLKSKICRHACSQHSISRLLCEQLPRLRALKCCNCGLKKNYVVTRLREVLKESFKASTYTVKQRKGEKGGIDVYIMRDATGGAK